MAKVQKIFESPLPLNFLNPSESREVYYQSFLRSNLGKIYQSIPWAEMVKALDLSSSKVGRKSYFSPQGQLALMFLKHYARCSDAQLIEQLNGNIHYQFFCGVSIAPDAPLENFKILSKIRCKLAARLDIDKVQQVLATHWKPHLDQTHSILIDATCYESSVRYPTDIKLLWESVSYLYDLLVAGSKACKKRLPRTTFTKWEARMQDYQKQRKPRKKVRRQLNRGLLHLLGKLIDLTDQLEKNHDWGSLPRELARRDTIKQVFYQQWEKFFEGKKINQRIISLDKPYLRPIVRGKEKKPVEFGAKVNKIQVDGISFIQKLSFEAFNEGTCLKDAVFMAQKYFGKVHSIGADRIYATNANRKYLTKSGIQTNFKRKGKAGKFEDQRRVLAKIIGKERATRLEGSFGNEKQRYLLSKIKARTKKTEILWIFFGIHTANALEIGRRIQTKNLQKEAA